MPILAYRESCVIQDKAIFKPKNFYPINFL